jgi:hypothetical protein
MTAEEERLLKAALRVSMVEQRVESVAIPECPVFTPTMEQWAHPMQFIRSIADVGYKHGIVKIIPPEGWRAPCGVNKASASRPLPTRLQHIHKLEEAQEYDDGKEYSLPQYKRMADDFAHSFAASQGWGPIDTHAEAPPASPYATRQLPPPSRVQQEAKRVEEMYWRIVQTGVPEVTVEYGNDQDVRVHGSGFPAALHSKGGDEKEEVDFGSAEYYRRTAWNLMNMAKAPGSLLEFMDGDVPGINVPWLYVGMLFATFAWHTEDNYMHSVNYMHYGSGKTWYGIPSTSAERFEFIVKQRLLEHFREEPDHLHKLTTVVNPAVLRKAGVPVFHTLQEPGQFIITFPRGYHSGFSHGFNIAEACNFATPDWIPYGRLALSHYASVGRATCFSHEEVIIRACRVCERFDAPTLKLLLADLRKIIEQERSDEAYFLSIPGVKPSQVSLLASNDARFNCAVSKRMCYMSAVVCHSPACRLEAEEARILARREFSEERARLIAMGVDPSGLVAEEPDHKVVRPCFAERLCDCEPQYLRMVKWFPLQRLAGLAFQVETVLRRKASKVTEDSEGSDADGTVLIESPSKVPKMALASSE